MSFDSEDGPRVVKQMKLVRDVENPRADGRKGGLFFKSVIPAGTKLSVTTYDRTYSYYTSDKSAHGAPVNKVEKIIEVVVHPDCVQHWSDKHDYPKPELRALLLQNAEEVEETISDWMRENRVSGRSGWSEEILEKLIATGRVTKDEVLATLEEVRDTTEKEK